jgi:SRSO17 transposase
VQHLGDPDGVLILDETGFLKKGSKSAGVQRQYSGTAGRIENCQIGVFLGYASRHGQVLIDRALYLPADWVNDPDRRRAAHIPTEIAFATKPKLGLAMLERARQGGIPFAWITGDSVYGTEHRIRRWAERYWRGYVLAVISKQYLGQRPVTSWIKRLPRKAWERLSAGDGAKGPRLYDWVYIPYSGAAPGFQCGLLVRRSIADPTELTFYLTHAPTDTSLARLVQIAGLRWPIESLFEQGKGEVGLDQYEVRSSPASRVLPPGDRLRRWVGWHRHITLSIFALTYLAAVRKDAIGGCGPDEPRRRAFAPYCTRGQTSAVGTGQPQLTNAARRPALVAMATKASATRTACSLA